MRSHEDDAGIERIIADIMRSKKYRNVGLCEDTVRDLLVSEMGQHQGQKDAIKAARRKLHRVVAPYLGDPDYGAATRELESAAQLADTGALRRACAAIMEAHVSTRERLPILDEFYPRIFEITGIPDGILDVACGLNPLSFLWMGLPTSTRYHAYDIHERRIGLINSYFAVQGMQPLAKVQDVLVHHPTEEGNVAFLFKEMHRFERRQRGSSLPLLDALPVRHVAVSFSTRSLSNRWDLRDQFRQLLHRIIAGRPWHVTEIEVQNEIVFLVEKPEAGACTSPGH